MNCLGYVPAPLSLTEVAEKASMLLNENAVQKKIGLVNNIRANIIVEADQNMINSVFHNLIGNAIKFSHPGGQVIVDAQQQEKIVTVSVKDEGVGMTPEKLNKLFRLDVQVSHQEKGTGLELILCKEFIEKNGGSLTVESTVNQGTTFFFTLPAA